MNKKFVRVFFIFLALFLVFILKSNVKAMTIEKDGVEYDLPDLPLDDERFNPDCYIIYRSSDGTCNLYSFTGFDPSNCLLFIDQGGCKLGCIGLPNGGYFSTDTDNSVRMYCWLYNGWTNGQFAFDIARGRTYVDFYDPVKNCFLYSSYNIYEASHLTGIYYSYSDTVYVPGQVPPVSGLVLAPIVTQEEMEKVPKEIILILPTILVVVVCYIGLRKALTMLSQILHRA